MQHLQLVQALEWCLELDIFCVSVYAFSIENFSRSPEEVELLMGLAETKLKELLQVTQMNNLFAAQDFGHKIIADQEAL